MIFVIVKMWSVLSKNIKIKIKIKIWVIFMQKPRNWDTTQSERCVGHLQYEGDAMANRPKCKKRTGEE